MVFQYEGVTYRLEFSRSKEKIKQVRGERVKEITSKYPYTTAKLLRLVSPSTIQLVATAKVGCALTDVYSHAAGRLWALKALTLRLQIQEQPKKLIGLMWEAYQNRALPRNKVEPPVPASAPAELPIGVVEGIVIAPSNDLVM